MSQATSKPATEVMTTETETQLPAQQQDASVSMIQVIERAALNPDVDVEKMERLWQMKEKIDAKQAEMEFSRAMTAIQKQARQVSADASNPQTRSRYASYSALDKALRPVYTEHGLALSFDTDDSPLDQHVRVICYVSHESGHSRRYHIDMPADGKGAKGGDVMTKTHATGSGISYGMRYLLKMIFNVAVGEEDDDGNGAGSTVERINDDQAANIEALAEEVGADIKRFLGYLSNYTKFPLESVSEIPAKMYNEAIKALEAKRK